MVEVIKDLLDVALVGVHVILLLLLHVLHPDVGIGRRVAVGLKPRHLTLLLSLLLRLLTNQKLKPNPN